MKSILYKACVETKYVYHVEIILFLWLASSYIALCLTQRTDNVNKLISFKRHPEVIIGIFHIIKNFSLKLLAI